MKNKILLFFILLSFKSFSQKIFSVDYSSQADLKVFVTDYESQADLKVFKLELLYVSPSLSLNSLLITSS